LTNKILWCWFLPAHQRQGCHTHYCGNVPSWC